MHLIIKDLANLQKKSTTFSACDPWSSFLWTDQGFYGMGFRRSVTNGRPNLQGISDFEREPSNPKAALYGRHMETYEADNLQYK